MTTTARRLELKKETYRDSITMLRISTELGRLEGVTQAAAVMATSLNKKILRDIGFAGQVVDDAKADDLIIAIEATEEALLGRAFSRANELLLSKETTSVTASKVASTLDAALAEMKDANLVVISVPGQYAKKEAMHALDKGLHVFLFSSNVSAEDELELKKNAVAHHLLMMGPDCGTSIINNVVLGFGNVVQPGPVGIVSASGTGMQQVATLLDNKGIGISQGIGVGGNDLSDKVGGLMMIEGIRLLNRDQQTKVIVLVSKPPGAETAKRVLEEASYCTKPVILNFLGAKLNLAANNCASASTLEEAAKLACQQLGSNQTATSPGYELKIQETLRGEWSQLAAGQKYVRGLYSGGTLCYEAQIVMLPALHEIRSNAPLIKGMHIQGDEEVKGQHVCLDMGAEEFVVGRAHPMIDFTLRKLRILREVQDPEVAVLLLDVVLGYGSHPDPAGELLPALLEAKKLAASEGRYLSIIASIIGTKKDPQQIHLQEQRLSQAGVILLPSNALAAKAAAAVVMRGATEKMGV